jgi:hypothetical protein
VSRLMLTPLDMGKLEIRQQLVHVLAAAPGTPAEGQIYYDSVQKTLSLRLASSWINFGRLDQIAAPTAAVALNAQKITGLANATLGTDAMNLTTTLAQRLDQFAAPNTALLLGGQKISNLADGTAATDAVTKQQLDAAAAGLDVHESARAASTANVAAGTYNASGGTSGRGQFTTMPNTIDGVTLAANDRVLLKDQTTGAQNGIWVVTTLGTGANGVWDRATDFDQDAEAVGQPFLFVEEGTANSDTGWVMTTNGVIVVGGGSGTAMTWSKFTASASAIGKFTGTIGDGSTTAIAVSHGLGQQFVTAQVYDATSNLQVECDITLTSSSVTTFTFAVAPTTNQYRVVIIG